MVFDVESLSSEELLATIKLIDDINCPRKNVACVDCPCFKICVFLRDVSMKCTGILVR